MLRNLALCLGLLVGIPFGISADSGVQQQQPFDSLLPGELRFQF